MNKNRILGWFFIIISVWWFIVGIKGVFMQLDCIKNSPPDMPVCGVIPLEIGVGIFAIVPLVIGYYILRKKIK